MPPRKSQTGASGGKANTIEDDVNSSVAAVGGDEVAPSSQPISYQTKQQKDAAAMGDGIDQYELARTQITKVAKSAIPENIQLRKEVILGLIKSSTIFINYLASAALDKTHEAGNKTLSANHVLSAFKEMGFPEESATQLRREYLDKVKLEAERTKANKAAKADAAKANEQSMDVDVGESGNADPDEARAVGDESIAVDLSKEGAEEDLAEEDSDDEEDEEEGNEEEDDDQEEADETEGAIGGRQESEAVDEHNEEEDEEV